MENLAIDPSVAQEFSAQVNRLPTQENDPLSGLNPEQTPTDPTVPETATENPPDLDPAALLEQKYHLDPNGLSELERRNLETAVRINLDTAEFGLMGDKIIAYDSQGNQTAISLEQAAKIWGVSGKFREEMRRMADLQREQGGGTTPEDQEHSPIAPDESFIDHLNEYTPGNIDRAIHDQIAGGSYDIAVDFNLLGKQLAALPPEQQDRIIAGLPLEMQNFIHSERFDQILRAQTPGDLGMVLAPGNGEIARIATSPEYQQATRLADSQTPTEFLDQVVANNPDAAREAGITPETINTMDQIRHAESMSDVVRTVAEHSNIPGAQEMLNSDEFRGLATFLDNTDLTRFVDIINSPMVPDFVKQFLKEINAGLDKIGADYQQLDQMTGGQLGILKQFKHLISDLLTKQGRMWGGMFGPSYFFNMGIPGYGQNGGNFMGSYYPGYNPGYNPGFTQYGNTNPERINDSQQH
ncbi:hypothetical protein IJJ08_05315 [bacterium]|nr:hypothetical protein [bacterium]